MSERMIVVQLESLIAMEYTPPSGYVMGILHLHLQGGGELTLYDSDPDFEFYKKEFDVRYAKTQTEL